MHRKQASDEEEAAPMHDLHHAGVCDASKSGDFDHDDTERHFCETRNRDRGNREPLFYDEEEKDNNTTRLGGETGRHLTYTYEWGLQSLTLFPQLIFPVKEDVT